MGFNSEAVIFFDEQQRIVKEMIYAEFEAVLDQVVGIADFAGEEVQAVYCQINQYLEITAAVFFLVEFDADGNASRNWNIPLSRLAESGGRGPDLGAGPIRLSCRSQCSISWHQHNLWDPCVEQERHSLRLLAMAIKRNRLGLDVEERSSIEPPVITQSLNRDEKTQQQLKQQWREKYQQKLQEILDEKNLRISAIKASAADQLEQLQQRHRQELSQLQQNIQQLKKNLQNETSKNQLLKQTLQEQAEDYAKARIASEQAMAELAQPNQQQLQEWQARLEQEKLASIDNATAELKETLQIKDIELVYRQQQLDALKEELAQLQQQQQQWAENGADSVIQNMQAAGIHFVSLLPDGEQLSISTAELPQYLQSPQDFIAARFNVESDRYGLWLAHFESPICNHPIDQGCCGRPIAKISKPSLFIPGESDRCSQHAGLSNIIADAINA